MKQKTSINPDEKSTTFICRFCGQTKPLDEMILQTRFFPVLTSCRDCEKKLQSLKIEEPQDELETQAAEDIREDIAENSTTDSSTTE